MGFVKKGALGDPKILIEHGEINHQTLAEERLSVEELESRLRVLGVWDYREIELAYFEPSGQISVKKKDPEKWF